MQTHNQHSNLPAIFKSVADNNALAELFTEFDQKVAGIKRIADFAKGKDDCMGYFFTGSTIASYLAKDLFNEKAALKVLNSEFWSKVIGMTDVLQSMPADKRNQWNEMIRERKTPDFTKETVITTIQGLLVQRSQFFAEKVDGIFRKLSGTHVTNSPMAFRKRMILDYVLDIYRYGKPSPNYNRIQYIEDFREVVAKITKRNWTDKRTVERDIRHLISEEQYGEWVDFDGGAWKMKIFKKGTCHIEVHPEIALELNLILASIHKSVIPHTKRDQEYRKMKVDPLRNDLISAEVLDGLVAALDTIERSGVASFYSKNYTKKEQDEINEALIHLGGIKTSDRDNFIFEYDVKPVLAEVIRLGYLPERKSHQFYPTKPELADQLIAMAEIKKGEKVLEPSAGHGGIAERLPKDIDLTCVEVNPVSCSVLEAKGFKTEKADFLYYGKTYTGKNVEFDKVFMNPPFANGQAKMHLEKAFTLLKNGGELYAILPAPFKDDEILKGQDHEYSEVIEDSFENTKVRVVLVKITKIGYVRTRFE